MLFSQCGFVRLYILLSESLYFTMHTSQSASLKSEVKHFVICDNYAHVMHKVTVLSDKVDKKLLTGNV